MAMRAAGLLRAIQERGVTAEDRGDVPGFRWRVDRSRPLAMNAEPAAAVARHVATAVAKSMDDGAAVLVLGGDCTVEIGTVAGASTGSERVGLVYVDLDADLNTPETTDDGALDWMGVAHLLGLPGTVPDLCAVGGRVPLLSADQVVLFGAGNITPAERTAIDDNGIAMVPFEAVSKDPSGEATRIVDRFAPAFDRLLVHVDVDVVDFLDLPLAEEARRRGLSFEQLVATLRVLVAAPNWVALTVCEANPDHGEADGSSMRTLCDGIADALGHS